jgi:hypothetical protein
MRRRPFMIGSVLVKVVVVNFNADAKAGCLQVAIEGALEHRDWKRSSLRCRLAACSAFSARIYISSRHSLSLRSDDLSQRVPRETRSQGSRAY